MNMQPMMDFTTFFLGAVADFLGTEPVFYLFSIVLLCFIGKFLKLFL